MKTYKQVARFVMVDNTDFVMFYLPQFVTESVYFIKGMETYMAADSDNDQLFIHVVWSKDDIQLERVIGAFGKDIKKVITFTPTQAEEYNKEEVHEEDITLFVKGSVFEDFEVQRVMLQEISHE